jgi:predicted small secreted protein
MNKKLTIAVGMLALIGAAATLSACNTTAGAGKDMSAAGNAVTESAKKNTP